MASLISCSLWALLVVGISAIPTTVDPTGKNTHGAVACESRICSEIGIELLEKGVSKLGQGLGHTAEECE